MKIYLESWATHFISPKSLGIILVIISSICFAFVPNSAKVALDEGNSLSFLLVSQYAIGVILLLPIMFLAKTKLTTPSDLASRIIKANLLAMDDDLSGGYQCQSIWISDQFCWSDSFCALQYLSE